MSSIYEKIINYLLENPGSKPRQIADSIGESLARVRRALYVLRDRGIIARSGQGYVVVKSRLYTTREDTDRKTRYEEKQKNSLESKTIETSYKGKASSIDNKWLSEIITNILKTMNELNKKINSIEKEISVIKARLETLEKDREKKIDRFISLIKQKKIMTLEEARQYMQKSLEYYVVNGYVTVISNVVVDRDYYDTFKRRFPLKVSEAKKLDSNDLLLLKKLIEEGIVYLHGGNEYRFVE